MNDLGPLVDWLQRLERLAPKAWAAMWRVDTADRCPVSFPYPLSAYLDALVRGSYLHRPYAAQKGL